MMLNLYLYHILKEINGQSFTFKTFPKNALFFWDRGSTPYHHFVALPLPASFCSLSLNFNLTLLTH
jgi:hypothetical protein